ncbi:MAG: OmpH family outer membrane protein [Pseudomonadota bacterium]|nr:OmpH family outer membrane protein [Pseudomonadota bacterium]
MKTLRIYAFALVTMMGFAAAAMADAAPAAVPIATVNIQLIMRDSTAAQNVREQLESKQKSFQSDISKKQDKLQKEQQDLGKQQSVLSKDAFAEKSRAFNSKVTEMQKEVQSKKALLDNSFERSIGEIQKVVTDIITDLAKEKGFAVAIPTSQILYGDSRLDITDEVLKRLNQKLPKLDVKFDESSSSKKGE